jgi:hypothetical protein
VFCRIHSFTAETLAETTGNSYPLRGGATTSRPKERTPTNVVCMLSSTVAGPSIFTNNIKLYVYQKCNQSWILVIINGLNNKLAAMSWSARNSGTDWDVCLF